jgi:two-component system, OmpR family, KDP operon response regulator KdpE
MVSDSNRSPSILVIESDPEGRSLLRTTLSTQQYLLNEATTATAGLRQIEALWPDAILLDPELPDMSGLDVIRQVRLLKYLSPIIVLSGKVNERDKVTALDAGADDFVEKPFAVEELLARLRAALRRVSSVAEDVDEPVFRTGGLEVNFDKREVRVRGHVVHLTPMEFRVLRTFVRYPNRVLTHSVLVREIWGADGGQYVRLLRVYVGQLRRKLYPDHVTWRHLQTEARIGYRFQTE